MKKTLLFFGMILGMAGLRAQECSDLFFSEYIEGSENNKGIEIYNPTAEMKLLSDYYVARYSNGSFDYDAGGITQLEGFLQPYKTHFLVNGKMVGDEFGQACDPELQALGQQVDHAYPAPTYMNGNDAIALFKDLGGQGLYEDFLLLDLFGIIGNGMTEDDLGWTDFTEDWAYKNIYVDSVLTGQDSVYIRNYIVPDQYYWLPWTKDHTLIRKRSVREGVKANPVPEFIVTMEWDTAAGGVDVWDHIGSHDCGCENLNMEVREHVWLRLYPNPSNDYLQLESDRPMEILRLIDALGRVTLQMQLKGEFYKRIELEGVKPGLYSLSVKAGDMTQNKRIIIVH